MRPSMLLVDDSPDDVLLFKRAAERARVDVEIQVALGGHEAITLLEDAPRCPFLLLVADLRMPGIGGLELLEYLRTRSRFRHLPRVVFTTSGLAQDIEAAAAAGAHGYVQKPMDLAAHDAAVSAILAFWIQQNRPPIPREGAP